MTDNQTASGHEATPNQDWGAPDDRNSVSFSDESEKTVSTQAITDLYTDNIARLIGALRKRFGDGPPDPSDVAQQAFQKLIERSDRPKIRNLEAFLWRTARNIMLKHKRSADVRSHRDFELEQIFFTPGGANLDPERVVSANEQLLLIQDIMKKMPLKRRSAFVLHRMDGLNVSETARRMKLSRTAVVKHLARAFADIDHALKLANDE